MFERDILSDLREWRVSQRRKPLVLRGLRQVGKTTLMKKFGEEFDHFLLLNLERPEDRKLFSTLPSVKAILEALFFRHNLPFRPSSKTLIFIDEIQELPEAFPMLRYFYEDYPDICVTAAGSLLETLFHPGLSFPVGRVEYRVLRPVSFPEFLGALGETQALDLLKRDQVPDFSLPRFFELFHRYALMGGMPEVVRVYAETRDLSSIKPVYDALLVSYLDDIEKYSSGSSQAQQLRHVARQMFAEAGKRIKFEGFGQSNYRSREMGEAFRTLEKAFLLQLVYPATGTQIPLSPDYKKSPRLQVFDTGMMNHFAGLQADILGTHDLNQHYQGRIIEHWVGQEILAQETSVLNQLQFWVREKKGSSAEVDYLLLYESTIIPVEVKSGPEGKLKSLHLFMEESGLDFAIRFYAGPVLFSRPQTPSGRKYHLLNLPYFLVSQWKRYAGFGLEWVKGK